MIDYLCPPTLKGGENLRKINNKANLWLVEKRFSSSPEETSLLSPASQHLKYDSYRPSGGHCPWNLNNPEPI